MDDGSWRDYFKEQGYCVLHDVLSANQVAVAQNLTRGIIARYKKGEASVLSGGVSLAAVTAQYPNRNPGVTDRQCGDEPYIIRDLMAIEPEFGGILASRRIWECLSDLLGCRLNEVVFHFANLTRKPKLRGPGIGWHRDAANKYFYTDDQRILRLLLPMQMMSKTNGGTEVVAGSHRSEDENMSIDARTCPVVRPGEGLVLHPYVLHGGDSNRSNKERDVLVFQFGLKSSIVSRRTEERLSMYGYEYFKDLAY